MSKVLNITYPQSIVAAEGCARGPVPAGGPLQLHVHPQDALRRRRRTARRRLVRPRRRRPRLAALPRGHPRRPRMQAVQGEERRQYLKTLRKRLRVQSQRSSFVLLAIMNGLEICDTIRPSLSFH